MSLWWPQVLLFMMDAIKPQSLLMSHNREVHRELPAGPVLQPAAFPTVEQALRHGRPNYPKPARPSVSRPPQSGNACCAIAVHGSLQVSSHEGANETCNLTLQPHDSRCTDPCAVTPSRHVTICCRHDSCCLCLSSAWDILVMQGFTSLQALVQLAQ